MRNALCLISVQIFLIIIPAQNAGKLSSKIVTRPSQILEGPLQDNGKNGNRKKVQSDPQIPASGYYYYPPIKNDFLNDPPDDNNFSSQVTTVSSSSLNNLHDKSSYLNYFNSLADEPQSVQGYNYRHPDKPFDDAVSSTTEPQAGYNYQRPNLLLNDPITPSTIRPQADVSQKNNGYNYQRPTIPFDDPLAVRPQSDTPQETAGYSYKRPPNNVQRDDPAPSTINKPQADVPRQASSGYNYQRPRVFFNDDDPVPSTVRPQADVPQDLPGYKYQRPSVPFDDFLPSDSRGYNYNPKPSLTLADVPQNALINRPKAEIIVFQKPLKALSDVSQKGYSYTRPKFDEHVSKKSVYVYEAPKNDDFFNGYPKQAAGYYVPSKQQLPEIIANDPPVNSYVPPQKPLPEIIANDPPINSYFPLYRPTPIPINIAQDNPSSSYGQRDSLKKKPTNSFTSFQNDQTINSYIPPQRDTQRDEPSSSFIAPHRDEPIRPTNFFLPPQRDEPVRPTNSYIPPQRDDPVTPVNSYIPPQRDEPVNPANSYIPPQKDEPIRPTNSYIPPQRDSLLNSYIPPQRDEPVNPSNSYIPPQRDEPVRPTNSYIPPQRDPLPNSYIPPQRDEPVNPSNSYIPPQRDEPVRPPNSYIPPQRDVLPNTYIPPQRDEPVRPTNSYIPPQRDEPDRPTNSYIPPQRDEPVSPTNSYIPPQRDEPVRPTNSYISPQRDEPVRPTNSYIPPQRDPLPNSYIPPRRDEPTRPSNSYIPAQRDELVRPINSYVPPERDEPSSPYISSQNHIPPQSDESITKPTRDDRQFVPSKPLYVLNSPSFGNYVATKSKSANTLQIQILNMSCMQTPSRNYFKTILKTSYPLENSPVVDSTGVECVIGKSDSYFSLNMFSDAQMRECGVRACSQPENRNGDVNMCLDVRFPTVRGLKLPEDILITLQCKAQERIVSQTKYLTLNSNNIQSRVAPTVATGGIQQDFNGNVALYRRASATDDFTAVVRGGSSPVVLGEEMLLRAKVKDSDGWRYSRLGDVTVHRVDERRISRQSVRLLDERGCRVPRMRTVCPGQQLQDPGDPLSSALQMRAFVFHGMRSGDDMVVAVRLIGCLERRDCYQEPWPCRDDSFGKHRGKRDASNRTTDWQSFIEFKVMLPEAATGAHEEEEEVVEEEEDADNEQLPRRQINETGEYRSSAGMSSVLYKRRMAWIPLCVVGFLFVALAIFIIGCIKTRKSAY